MLPANRSIPAVTVIPVLPYPNVREATAWLCGAFGFTERLRIGGHRIQLTVGGGAVVAAEGSGGPANVMVRVANAQAHHAPRRCRWRQDPRAAHRLPLWRAAIQRGRPRRSLLDLHPEHRRRRRRAYRTACAVPS